MVALQKLDPASAPISSEASTEAARSGRTLRVDRSPARDLLKNLQFAYRDEPVVRKWPLRYRALLVALVPLAMWILIGLGLYELLKR